MGEFLLVITSGDSYSVQTCRLVFVAGVSVMLTPGRHGFEDATIVTRPQYITYLLTLPQFLQQT